jgi:DNA-binding transcriptional LysR family regulator
VLAGAVRADPALADPVLAGAVLAGAVRADPVLGGAVRFPVNHVDLALLAAAASTGTLVGAARTAGLTESAARRQLTRLERRLGVPLLADRPGGVEVTAAGRILLTAGRGFLAAVARGVRQVSARTAGRRADPLPCLRLAAFGRGWDGFADDLAARLPGMLLTLRSAEPATAGKLFDRRAVDAVYAWQVAGHGLALTRTAEVLPVLDEQFWVALPAGHPAAHRVGVRLADLADDTWIAGATEQSERLLRAVCTAAGFGPRIGHAAPSPAAARSLVGHGHGIALASPLTPRPPAGARLVFRPLTGAAPRQHLLAADTAVVGTRLARVLVDRLRASYAAAVTQRNPGQPAPAGAPEPDHGLLAGLAAAIDPTAGPGGSGDRLDLDLDDLRVLEVIGQCGSLNRAARVLLTSQPSLSRRVQRLERRLGTPLFRRGYWGTELAPAACQLLAAVADAETAFRDALAAVSRRRPAE